MALNNGLILWPFGRRNLPIKREDERWESFGPLGDDVNRLFEDFFKGPYTWPSLATERSGGFQPRVDLSETDAELKVSAELPGLREEDIDLSLSNDALTIKGEKKEEKEEKTQGYYRVERHYGSFERTIPLPCEIESDKVDASFKNGVLTVTLPKSAKAQNALTKIAIKRE
jgi:HSP20 family protein